MTPLHAETLHTIIDTFNHYCYLIILILSPEFLIKFVMEE
jgi:hypothetical protein